MILSKNKLNEEIFWLFIRYDFQIPGSVALWFYPEKIDSPWAQPIAEHEKTDPERVISE